MLTSWLQGRVMQHLAASPAGSAAAAAAAGHRLLPAVVASRRQLLLSSSSSSNSLMSTTTKATGEEFASASGEEPATGRAFVGFNVYKSKGALSVKPIKPTWSTLPSKEPGGPPNFRLDKEGGLMFEVAAALGERRYDWERKVLIQLRPEEAAQLVAEPDKEHNLYHDTFKGTPGREGVLTKTLKWSQAPDKNAYFINVSSSNKDDNSRNSVSVSLTNAEFYALKTLIDFSLPYMYGFDVPFTRF